ncbi:NUDIX hydrolase [Oceanicoccus sp. KOV_DT_Chl]|uniref:NUDIX domain-containing protein n=1 Tax=Oceanicoccus sp. KOV_DT_Chl TaxID=1904639 RepID=UPI000C7D7207|nr:NUDIX hydrolase [Oceanicoccus sp. KOV_DT_Chl]
MSSENDKNSPVAIGPWWRKSSELIYDNPWISLRHEEVITPAGSDGIYGKIHFKNRALGIIPLDENLQTVLVGQYRYALDEYSWEIPMGGGSFDQSPLSAAQRELQEETGLHGGDWQQLFKLHTSNSVTDEEGYVFLARNLQPGQQALEDTEGDLVLKQLPLKDAVAMVTRGEITDLISIAGLLAVEKLLKSGD